MTPDIYVTDTGQAYGAANNPELKESCSGYYSEEQVAKMREELAAAEAEEESWMKEAVDQRERAEAAEANLKAASEPYPYGFQPAFVRFREENCGCKYAEYELQLTDCGGEFEGDAPTLYTNQPVPADVHEQIAKAREEGRKEGEEIATHERVAILNNGREEGRNESIPDGWQVVPKEPTIEMLEAMNAGFSKVSLSDAHTEYGVVEILYYEMLASAPEV